MCACSAGGPDSGLVLFSGDIGEYLRAAMYASGKYYGVFILYIINRQWVVQI